MLDDLVVCRCGPCRVVFPHITDLAKKHEKDGLKVVGVCLEELSPKLTAFVQQQGDKMGYTVRLLLHVLHGYQ